MIKSQAVNLPTWKIISWYAHMKQVLEKCEIELKEILDGTDSSVELFLKLSKHWEKLNPNQPGDQAEPNPGSFQVLPTLFNLFKVARTTVVSF